MNNVPPAASGPWRDFFHLVQLLRIPLLSSLFSAFILSFPDQSIDSYISIAQNVRLARPWTHLTDLSRLATGAVLVAGLAAAAVLGASLWRVCHDLLLSNHENHGRWVSTFRRFALPLVVALPAIGLTFGAMRAAFQVPNAKVVSALIAARDVPPGLAQDIIRSAFEPTLPYVLVGIAGVLSLFLLLAVAVVERSYASRLADDMPVFPGITRRLLFAALCAVLLIAVGAWSARTAQTLGSLAIFALFMAVLTLVAGFLDRHARLSGIPILGLLVIWAIGLAAAGINDNHQIRLAYDAQPTPSGQSPPATTPVGAAFEEWYGTRTDKAAYHDRGLRYPVYVVAAQGGGIYAAYHAAVFLAGMQDGCPTFRKHLFAVSSVSGGSIGAAIFHALLKGEPLRDEKCSADLPPLLSDKTEQVLSADLLAPLVAAFLVPDFVQRFLPVAFPQLDRARALERALEASLEATTPAGEVNPLAARLVEHWRPGGNEPALLMGTTEVGTGRVRVLAPFSLPSKEIKLFGRDQGYAQLSVSTAAVLSARFPWITPAAWFTEQQTHDGHPHAVKVRLVDGGIFENSGVAIALEVIRALEQAASRLQIADKIDLNLIVLTDGEGATSTFPRLDFGEFLDPIRAFLSTRSARAPLTIALAERELNERVQPEYAQFAIRPTRVRRAPLESMGIKLPLGWHLSHTAMLVIDAQTGDPTKCSPTAGYRQGQSGRFESDCVVDLVHHELNGTLLERLNAIGK